MAHTNTHYARYIYADNVFMPQSYLMNHFKHEGPIKAQTRQQYNQERYIALHNLPRYDYHCHNTARAAIRAKTQAAGGHINHFPIPFIPQDPLAYTYREQHFIARPHESVLSTNHIPDNIWYSLDFQWASYFDGPDRKHLDIVELAFIAERLASKSQTILQQYRLRFLHSRYIDDDILRVIEEVKWRAKEGYWSPAEIRVLRDAHMDGIRDADNAIARLIQKWPRYPKSWEEVARKWEEITATAFPPPYPLQGRPRD